MTHATKTIKNPRAKTSRVLADLSIVDPAQLGASLVDACLAATERVNAIRADAEQRADGEQLSLLRVVADSASKVPGLTEQAYEAKIGPAIKAQYIARGVKSWPTQASVIKIALLALSNGIKPEKSETSLYKFVKRARVVCQSNGIIVRTGKGAKDGNKNGANKTVGVDGEVTIKGRPVGSVDTSELPSDRETACEILARTDVDLKETVVAERVRMLLIATKPAHWRKLEAFLIELTSKPGIK